MKNLSLLRTANLILVLNSLLLLFGIFSNAAIAQPVLDVVYLKNGSIIKGNITEQIIGKNLKLETRDGNLFVFEMDEIEKIGKDYSQPKLDNHNRAQNVTQQVKSDNIEQNVQVIPQIENNVSRTRIGISVGTFSIDLDNFDEIYESSSGICYGVNLDLGVSSTYSSLFRFKYFSKSGTPIGERVLSGTAEWKELWILLGGQVNINTSSNIVPYFGGGLAYVNVSEEISATIYVPNSYYTNQVNASFNQGTIGFSFIGGLSIGLSNRVFINGDMEYTIANMKGEGGVGGKNIKVGGLFIGLGINFGI